MVKKPLLGVALGGGVAKGWAHIGVLKTLCDAGLRPDIIVGTSIGSVVGGCYAAQKLDELEEWVNELTVRKVFKYLDFNLKGQGVLGGVKLQKLLSEKLDDIAIADLDKKFIAVATECKTGREIWLNKGKLVKAMSASYALPGIFKPVNFNGTYLMDGAIVNPVPVSVCRALGADMVIGVNLNKNIFQKGGFITDAHFLEEDNQTELFDRQDQQSDDEKRDHSALKLLHRQLVERKNGEAPGISTALLDAFNITQDRIARARLAGDPPDLMINPHLEGVSLFDFHKGEEAIKRGEKAAQRALNEIDYMLSSYAQNVSA